MRRGTMFLTGLAAAAITFSSLMAFVGIQNFNRYGYRHHYWCNGRNYDSTRISNESWQRKQPNETQGNNNTE